MHDDTVETRLLPIGAVVELLRHDYPDVSHSSLRFLEREGLIDPTRTAGGHRLFSPADIRRVRQIKGWQLQRMSLDEIRHRLEAQASAGTPAELAGRFLERALSGDLTSARRGILDASDFGVPLATLLVDVLGAALNELGDRWEQGTVSVAQEKEVSEVARELIAELTLRHSSEERDSRVGIVAACVAGEQHELGLRIVGGLLRACNVMVHYLGASVDPDFLVDSVRLRRPGAVLLSATMDGNLASIQRAARALREAGIDTRIVAGGQAVARHADIVSAWGVEVAGESPDEIVASLAGSD